MISLCGSLRERISLFWPVFGSTEGAFFALKHPSPSLEAVFMIKGSCGRGKITVILAGAHSSLNFCPMCHCQVLRLYRLG